jgi:hypothetical protein
MTDTFNDLEFRPHQNWEGVIATHKFGNGYSASVIKSEHSYGGRDGKYELAVIYGNEIVYDTPITDDVLGWLSEEDVTDAMERIANLPARETAA